MKNQRTYIEAQVKEVVLGLLNDRDEVSDLDKSFLELGINSVLAVELVEALNQRLGINLGVEVVFDYKGIKELVGYILDTSTTKGKTRSKKNKDNKIRQELEIQVKEVMADLLKPMGESLDLNNGFLELGINSVLAVEMVETLNQKLKIDLGVEVIFDYRGAKELSEFIYNQYGLLCGRDGASQKSAADDGLLAEKSKIDSEANKVIMTDDKEDRSDFRFPEENQISDIAIIGMSGRFAGANTLEEFWEHLQAGDSCIEEITREGWEENKYFDPNPLEKNKSISKWGGLLQEIDKFDAPFFNISPLEAERMDPQQRLFLEEAFKVFEDGGYSADALSGRKIGIFVGGRTSDYKEKTLMEEEINSQTFLGNDMSILAARISYFLNLKGPNLSVDTACSSSLAAIHLASESIRSGESEMALAGGVFIVSSPEFYVMASKTNMLSPDGKCKTFDDTANGIVVGEGVGALLLKRFDSALKDGDHIYGIIKGSQINQDGRTKGITAPSMLSQKSLIYETYKNARISPETISYIEAHGTGTKLGDPIEIKALTEAFRMFTDKTQFCAIGSHKPNFGHTIMSAGIAGVFKILLGMKYGKIPPTLHVTETNKHIDFESSPFFINTKLSEWKREDGVPLRAGVSSFGFSGTNCHVVIEEPPVRKKSDAARTRPYYFFPFSAKTVTALNQKLKDMEQWLQKESHRCSVEDVFFTLLLGRTHFPVRCAFIAKDMEELQQEISKVLKQGTSENYLRNERQPSSPVEPLLKELKEYGSQLIEELRESDELPAEEYKEKIFLLASLYNKQYDLPWECLFGNGTYRRIPLPTYPFDKERYWIPRTAFSPTKQRPEYSLHPLLHQNTSTLSEQRFSSTFTGQEFFLKDHVVKGEKVLPGAASLEMTRAAVAQSINLENRNKRICIKNVVWIRPIMVGKEPIQVHIGLYPEDRGEIAYEIYSENIGMPSTRIVYCRGHAMQNFLADAAADLTLLQEQCSQNVISAEECYTIFSAMGLEYGPGHRGIERICLGDGKALAKLFLPSSVSGTQDRYALHPSLIDSALQASVSLMVDLGHTLKAGNLEPLKPFMPFALRELEILENCSPVMWAFIRFTEGSTSEDALKKLDIDLLEDTGKVCVRMKGFSARRLEEEISAQALNSQTFFSPNEENIFQKQQPKPDFIAAEQMYANHQASAQEEYLPPAEADIGGALHVGGGITDQMVENHVRTFIRESIAEALRMEEGQIQDGLSFSSYGIDSIIAVGLINLINGKCRIALQTTVVFDYNNVNQLTRHILQEHKPTLISSLRGNMAEIRNSGIERVEAAAVINENVRNNSSQSGENPVRKRFSSSEVHLYPAQDLWRNPTGYYRVVIERPGGVDDLQVVQAPVPALGEHEVRIAVRAFSLNFGDLLCVRGLYPTMPPYPFTPGFEASGVVVDVGHAVTSVRCGDEVIAVLQESLGGHASLVTCPAESVLKKPESLSFEEACSLPAVAVTMIDAFRKARLKRGERILIQTAAGGTGLIAVQLAKYYGAEIYATASSQHKLDYLKKLGVTYGINYLETDFAQEVQRLTGGKGVDVIINTLPGDALQKGLNCLSPGGRYIEIAMTALKTAKTIDLSVLSSNQTFHSVNVSKLGLEDPHLMKEYRSEMLQLVEQGIIKPTLSRVFSLDQVKEAYKYMENRHNIGKIIVCIPERYRFDRGASVIPAVSKEGIAIIGMSGRFAKSNHVNELWEHLSGGRDATEEVTRWDLSAHYPQNEKYCNHGGFIENIAGFDPLFFNISGLEATYMDPQQRVFLEESWKTLEDAGYAGVGSEGRRCGVYVGCHGGDYQKLFDENAPAQAFWGNAGSVIPARISYYLDLHGPAVAIDTACSSSLVAIHIACQGLWSKETDMALAGGVFLQCTPEFHLACSRAGMLSPTGHCHTFDERADGFVPGEGVGVIALKRLEDAIADGDHIYGVIRGSGINQDGATNGITAPSMNAQERLEHYVYNTFGINPERIGMVEAHGTGTKLGDPIEFEALTKAFRRYTDKKQFCAIGSIKANIGHTSAAAGVAGVIKILLAFRHKQIPPSSHFQLGNSNIEFKDSPFYVNTDSVEWDAQPGFRRCAAVSSFGFSGTNAHMVIEEAPPVERRHPENPGYLVVLSAHTFMQLQQQAEQLAAFCESEAPFDLGDMSFTLLMGRKHFYHRLACVVRSRNELTKLLRKWLEKGKLPEVYISEINENSCREQPSLKRYGNECILNCRRGTGTNRYLEDLAAIAELYVQGYSLDFDQLYPKGQNGRISLPVYPFAGERYWVSENVDASGKVQTKFLSAAAFIHPLLHRNTSVFSQQRFSSTFTGREFFVRDHVVRGQRVLPGVAYLEMAMAAVLQAAELQEESLAFRMENVAWIQPISVGNAPVQVDIHLFPKENGEIHYEIYTRSSRPGQTGTEAVLHCQGSVLPGTATKAPVLDILSLTSACSGSLLLSGQVYENFKSIGIDYGRGHRGIEKIYAAPGQVLAEILLPSCVSNTLHQFFLHPSIMDCALQAAAGLEMLSGSFKLALPFALQELEVYGRCTSHMWALVRYSDANENNSEIAKMDIELCDETGKVCIRLRGLTARMMEGKFTAAPSAVSGATSDGFPTGTVVLTPCWEAMQPQESQIFPLPTEKVVVIGGVEEHKNALLQHCSHARFLDILPQDSIEEIESKLGSYDPIQHIVWMAPQHVLKCPDLDALIDGQNQGVIQVYRIIKSLLRLGYGSKNLGWNLISIQSQPAHKNDRINPMYAGLHGLAGSLAKEYPNWKIKMVDIEAAEALPAADIFSLPVNSQGNLLLYRNYEWYRQKLVPVNPAPLEKSFYRPEGVYVVVGGAGGIGEVWTEYMIRTYDARIIWIGRRQKDADIERKLKRLAALGQEPLYIPADATDRSALQKAYETIKSRYSCIHGVIHSAIVLQDRSLANMEEQRFRAVLSTKVDVSVRIAQVFGQEPLDFILFFSSMNSFTKAPGQSNYVAGCTFEDAFARYLSQEKSYAVKVVNWAYWGSVGIVASKSYRERMAQQGFGSIEPPEAMEVLEMLLAGPIDQVALLKTVGPLELEGMDLRESIVIYDEKLPLIAADTLTSLPKTLNAQSEQDLRNEIQLALVRNASELLTVKVEEIDPDAGFDEYGLELVKISEFADKLNGEFGLELTSAEIYSCYTLKHLADYIIKEHKDVLLKDKKMEMLLCKLLFGQLQSMGLFDGNTDTGNLKGKSGIIALYDRWLEESLAVLVRKGFLTFDGQSYSMTGPVLMDVEHRWQEWELQKELWTKDPGMEAKVILVEAVMRVLPEILTGKQPATAIMFPNASMKLVEGIYKNNKVADYFNDVLADTLVAYIEERLRQDSSMKIRIIEIGAGTGGTSSKLFAKLKPYEKHIQEYCYTDISKAFLLHAEKEYGPENPYLTYQIFNVDAPAAAQNINAGGYDVAVAANVLHATKNIRRTLRNAKAALRKNGLLLLNEITDNTLFNHLTFGLLEGWWLYEDQRLRIPGCPALSCESWQAALESEGFRGVFFPVREANQLGQQIIVAGSDGIVRLNQPTTVNAVPQLPTVKKERGTPLKAKENQRRNNVTDTMLEEYVAAIIRKNAANILRIKEERILDERNFSEYGIDSILAVNLVNLLNAQCSISLQTTALFDYNSVNRLTRHMLREYKPELLSLMQESIPEVREERMKLPEEILPAPPGETRNGSSLREECGEENSSEIREADSGIAGGRSLYHRVVVSRPGGIDDIQVTQSAVPSLKENEVRVAVHAFSLNFGDLLCIRGLYPTMPPYPFTPGFEASGVVVDVGSAVTSVRCGDAVIAVMQGALGGQASMLSCPSASVLKKPAKLSFEEACSLPAVAVTMLDAFRKAKLKKGEKILIQTAAGGTGLIAVQLAKYYGAEIYATAGSQHKLDYLKELGISHRINYREMDFEKEIHRLTYGKGVDVVINTLPGDALQKGLNCLAPGGRYIEIAMTALKSARNIDLSVLNSNQTFFSVNISKLALENPELIKEYWNEMLQLVENGVIQPTLSQVFSLDEIKEAYYHMENRENIGKIVVSVPESYRFGKTDPTKISLNGGETFAPASSEGIAIVGMSGKFPMSRDLNEFWQNNVDGKNCITEIPEERWDWKAIYGDPHEDDSKCNIHWGGFIEGVKDFDPLFFGISPREAEIMDPQQRLLMTYVWMALEDAGIPPKTLSQRATGVFVSAAPNEYANIVDIPEGNPLTMTAALPAMIPNRISYALDLHGPSEYCNTGCSSALVALHRAIQSIQNRECSQAIVGAVNLLLSPRAFINLGAMGYLSPDGRSKPFQQEADGFVRSEGVGVIILKPLQDAIKDRDPIYAVIKGTGVCHGGKGLSLTAPTANGMKNAMIQAYQAAGIDLRTVSYIEAHGTASLLGDAIEISALKTAYRELAEKYPQESPVEATCYIGSLKPCMGHGELVSGMAALYKAVLSIRHQRIPGIPGLTALNENISLEGSPFKFTNESRTWEALRNAEGNPLPRRAGINSYGIGGVNAHVVMEEYIPPKERSMHVPRRNKPQIFVFSARNQDRLQAVVQQTADFIAASQELSLSDLAYTLQVGREEMESRLALIATHKEELLKGLKEYRKAVQENRSIEGIAVFKGDLEEEPSADRTLFSDRVGEIAAYECLAENDLQKIAAHWVRGGKIPWEKLHKEEDVRRIPLPTYPFSMKAYWISTQDRGASIPPSRKREQELVLSDRHAATEKVRGYILEFLSHELSLPASIINIDRNIQNYGADSILYMKLMRGIEHRLGIKVKVREMLEYRTVTSLSAYVTSRIENSCSQKMAVSAEPETKPPKAGDYKDEQIIRAMEAVIRGKLDLQDVRELIKEGGIR